MKSTHLFLIVLGFIAFSCNKTDEDVQDFGYDYFPLVNGNYIEYHVLEYTFDDFNNTVDTNEYFLKEIVKDTILDSAGRTVRKLVRSTMAIDDSTNTWKIINVWTTYADINQAQRVENNVTFVNLTFPLRKGRSWDGNARNTLESQTYVVLDYDLKNTIRYKLDGKNHSNTFIKTTRINQRNEVNLIEENFAEEIYARDIGLIYKAMRDVEIDPSDSSIVSGYDHVWSYVSHGRE